MQGNERLAGIVHGLQGFEADCIVKVERPNTRTAQRRKVRAATQSPADVLSQRADIGALAAGDPHPRACAIERKQLEFMNGDTSRRALELDALTGIFV